jgi:hypothetical protein
MSKRASERDAARLIEEETLKRDSYQYKLFVVLTGASRFRLFSGRGERTGDVLLRIHVGDGADEKFCKCMFVVMKRSVVAGSVAVAESLYGVEL